MNKKCITTDFLIEQDLIAMNLVKDYVINHMDKSDSDYQKNIDELQVFTVWKCKTLQNWKYLISTSLHDGMYYELTYNGDKREWYLDAYRKVENQCIRKEMMIKKMKEAGMLQ